ncbi:MAG: glycosyltransferase, partial [Aridibacter famidurans]|nr:glycosyltransferase [Aridibacter famidurans]
IVSGPESLRQCVSSLLPQMDAEHDELIVPYDEWSVGAVELAEEFPRIRFVKTQDAGTSVTENAPSLEHRLYDRRRAIGLAAARGRLIAMTEDHAVPAENWLEKIVEAHRDPAGAIGGAIGNRVDRPLNWAQYYCDFGRYGPPFENGPAAFVSDVNVSYKRQAILEVKDVWEINYRETEVHDEMSRRALVLKLNDRLVVYQNRPAISLRAAFRERIEWGRVYGEIRSGGLSFGARMAYAAGTALLPFVLVFRVVSNIRRQKRPSKHFFTVVPLAFLLLVFWSFGELTGYIAGDKAANELRKKSGSEGEGPTAA